MKQRKRGINLGVKTCKNCFKEYIDSENFNWSCRTYRSEFSGQMWWCCGKTTKDALGCKFFRHISREDEEDEEDEKYVDDQDKSKTKTQKCTVN